MIVLLASNIIVPLTEGSFLLVLKEGNNQKIQNFSNQSDFHYLTQRETSMHRHTYIPSSQLSGPRSPISRSIFSAVNTKANFTFS